MRTREGMAIARANGKLTRKQPNHTLRQRPHMLNLVQPGDHTIAELAELFAVSRATIYREIARARPPQAVRWAIGERTRVKWRKCRRLPLRRASGGPTSGPR